MGFYAFFCSQLINSVATSLSIGKTVCSVDNNNMTNCSSFRDKENLPKQRVVSGHLLSNRQLVSNKNKQKQTFDESQDLENTLTDKSNFLSLISVILRDYYIKIR